jgi:integrase
LAERLTDRGIAALKPTSSGNSDFYFDSAVSGLAIRVYPSGRKSFVFDWRHHGRQRRITLGSPPVWTVGQARLHAGKLRLKADTGETVAPERGGARVSELIRQWYDVVALTRRPATARSYERMIRLYIVPTFGRFEPNAITRNTVEAWHGQLARDAVPTANRALATMSSFFTWLERADKVARNVAVGVRKAPEHSRHVFLDASEIEAAHTALEADRNRSAALALRLALLTGARISEAIGITAEQLDVERKIWIKAASATKQRRWHIVPLQGEAIAIAQKLLSLPSSNYFAVHYTWRRVRTVIGREDVRVHDLRHSRASALARGGASLPQIAALLGHVNPATTARYAHLVAADLRDLVERS